MIAFKGAKGIKDCSASALAIFANLVRSMCAAPLNRENSAQPRQPGRTENALLFEQPFEKLNATGPKRKRHALRGRLGRSSARFHGKSRRGRSAGQVAQECT